MAERILVFILDTWQSRVQSLANDSGLEPSEREAALMLSRERPRVRLDGLPAAEATARLALPLAHDDHHASFSGRGVMGCSSHGALVRRALGEVDGEKMRNGWGNDGEIGV